MKQKVHTENLDLKFAFFNFFKGAYKNVFQANPGTTFLNYPGNGHQTVDEVKKHSQFIFPFHAKYL